MSADQFVLKIQSRCDLACDHCYVYESADQSWHGRPMAIAPDVVAQTAMRIAEHVKTHDLSSVGVVLHGGEPLLAGVSGLRRILAELTGAVGGLCRVDVRVHTNGVLLSEKFCELFDEYDVRVGISLDGDRAANDRHRRYRDGRSSYDQAVRAIRLIDSDRFRHLYAGLLTTIDIANDPLAVYESLLGLNPPRLDLLLPHATWDSPPARAGASGTEYADWLIAVFDRWWTDGRPVKIRTFDSIIALLAGGQSGTEALGLTPVRMVVVETDGTYEQADSLKVAYEGAPATGLDVFRHSADAVIEHPGLAARQRGLAGLCAACRQCPVVTTCGGGMYAHRYKSASDFNNPSVYCDDLFKLIEHIRAAVPHLAATARRPKHAISDGALAEFAAGLGGAEAVGELLQAHLSLRRALLTAVYQAGTATSAVPAAVKDGMRRAWQVLAVADEGHSEALDGVLGHPYLSAWTDRCLERLRSADLPDDRASVGDRDGETGRWTDLGHLGAIAAAVAIRERATAQVTVPVVAGSLHLPGLGRIVIRPAEGGPTGGGAEWASLETDPDWLRVRVGADALRLPRSSVLAYEPWQGEPCAPDGARASTVGDLGATWEPVRVLTAPGIGVECGDTGLGGASAAAPRLTDDELARWQRDFALAWRQIESDHSAYGPALAAGLAVLSPRLAGSASGDVDPATSHVFGVVELDSPAEPATLALELIRGFQHAKLAGLLEIVTLVEPADSRPRRAATEPADGLLHSAYAGLAVAEFWRARAELGEYDYAEAQHRYERWRADTAKEIDALTGSNSLTSLGARFVEGMRTAISAPGGGLGIR